MKTLEEKFEFKWNAFWRTAVFDGIGFRREYPTEEQRMIFKLIAQAFYRMGWQDKQPEDGDN